jgi:hypothetical protein
MQWMTQLSVLQIHRSRQSHFRPVPVRAIQAIADHCRLLTKVWTFADFDGKAEGALVNLMRGNPGLSDVSVWSERQCITDPVVIALAEHCPQLRSLMLKSTTNLTDASVTLLARRCTALQTLDLDCCTGLTDESVLALAAYCPVLQGVNLSCSSRIRETAVVQLVRSCPQLTSLVLFITSLSEETAQRLQKECPQLFIDTTTNGYEYEEDFGLDTGDY